MVTRVITVTACDLCPSTDDVRTHTVRVNRWTRVVDACSSCWSDMASTFERVRSAGRKIRA